MAQTPPHIRIVRAIDKFTDFTGTLVAWFNVLLVAAGHGLAGG